MTSIDWRLYLNKLNCYYLDILRWLHFELLKRRQEKHVNNKIKDISYFYGPNVLMLRSNKKMAIK